MRFFVGLIIALVPTVAAADKTYNDGKGGTWDCAKDASITINANSGTYTFKGTCKTVSINGNENTVTIEKATRLDVNGNENTATITTVEALSTNGNDNTVTYKTGSPKISNPGTDNKISGGGKASKPTDKPADKPSESKPNPAAADAIDCAKTPETTITDGGGIYKFVGACTKISVVGGSNTVAIEKVTALSVTGSKNTIDVDATDKIAAIGADNTIHYKKGIAGAKPKISIVGKNNKIEKVK